MATNAAIALYLKAAIYFSWFDVPNQRSSHSHPTISGAGIALLPAFVVANVYVGHRLGMPLELQAALFFSVFIAFMGWQDDRVNLSARLRLAVFVVISIAFVAMLPMSSGLLFAFSVLFLIGFINAFNFMDGIDGIALCEALFVLLAMVYFIPQLAAPAFTAVLWVLSALVAALLCWNWPPARLFCGDAGSTFLGFLLAALFIYAHAETILPLSTSLILVAAFVSDAGVTLVARLCKGEKITQAHRSHAYQLLAIFYGDHKRVCGIMMLLNIAYLLPLAFLTEAGFMSWQWSLLLAYLPIMVIVSFLRKRLL